MNLQVFYSSSLIKIRCTGKSVDLLMKICTKLEASCIRAVFLMPVTLQQMLIKNLKSWYEDMNCHLICVMCTLMQRYS